MTNSFNIISPCESASALNGLGDKPLSIGDILFMEQYYLNHSIEDLPNEEWRDAPYGEGFYMVSNYGRIKSVNRVSVYTNNPRPDKILKQKKHKRGYKMISLYVNGKCLYKTVHRLVALAFIPNQENKRTINHKNGIKWDNRVENLEWATDSENGIHSFRFLNREVKPCMLGKFGKDHNKSKAVLQYDLNGVFISEYGSQSEAQRLTSVPSGQISAACRFKNGHNQEGGFFWLFKGSDIVFIKNPKARSKPIVCLKQNGDIVKRYSSVSEAALEIKIDRSYLAKLCRNNSERDGLIWKYI